jgi:hypothetical protein
MNVGMCSLCNGLVQAHPLHGIRCTSCGALPALPTIPMRPAPLLPFTDPPPTFVPWSPVPDPLRPTWAPEPYRWEITCMGTGSTS